MGDLECSTRQIKIHAPRLSHPSRTLNRSPARTKKVPRMTKGTKISREPVRSLPPSVSAAWLPSSIPPSVHLSASGRPPSASVRPSLCLRSSISTLTARQGYLLLPRHGTKAPLSRRHIPLPTSGRRNLDRARHKGLRIPRIKIERANGREY